MKFFLWAFVILTGNKSFAAVPYFLLGFSSGLKTDSMSEYTGHQPYGFRAGDAMFLGGGAILDLTKTYPQTFELHLGLNWQYISDSSDDQKPISWTRYQAEALYYFKNQISKFRLGWGPVYLLRGYIAGHGINSTASSVADKTLGWAVAADFNMSAADENLTPTDYAVGLRYTRITYSAPNFSNEINGDSIALVFVFNTIEKY